MTALETKFQMFCFNRIRYHREAINEAERRILGLAKKSVPIADIATLLGCSYTTILNHVNSLKEKGRL